MAARRLTVVSAGVRRPSSTRLLADQLAAATQQALGTTGIDAELYVIELRDHAHEIANSLLSSFPAGGVRAAVESVAKADGPVAVTPIFTASYSGLFKSFFDVLEADSLVGTPVLIAATGGTARHSLVLDHAVRPLLTYLRAVVAPTAVYGAAEDWGAIDHHDGGLADRIDRAAAELADLVADRDPIAVSDPYQDPTPFEHLLTGGQHADAA